MRLGYAKLGAMGAVVALTLGLLFWISTLSVEPKGLLYSGLDPSEAAKIGQRLDELKVPFDVKGDGTTIMVPASQVPRIRMELAASGLPHQGGAGYELLDQQSPMNMTSFMQRIQRLRALEGELARTIVTMGGVKTARVHIVLPERESFSRETPKPTASVAVTMAGASRLTVPQASSIRLLVSGAVPGMAAGSVSVLDPSGIVLAADDSETATSGRITDLKTGRERDLQRTVTDLLEPMIGRGKVRVAASVDLDSAREVLREEKFDPLSQVERSKQLQVDQEASNETKSQDSVSVSQNLPNQNQQRSGEPGKTSSSNSRNGQTINYELNSVRSERVREAGELRRLTIAVVVDGMLDEKGQYQPRPQEELTRLADVIQAAVGFDAKRGDRVTVENMRFMPLDQNGAGAVAEAGSTIAIPYNLIAALLTSLILAGAGIMALRMRQSHQLALVYAQSSNQAATTPALSEAAALALPAGQAPLALGAEGDPASQSRALAIRNPLHDLPDHNGFLSTLYDLVDARPDEAVAVIRSWLASNA